MSSSESSIVERIAALNQPQEAPQEAPQATQQEVPQEAPQEAPETAAPVEQEVAEAPEPTAEEIEIGDLNDLANHLGVDPADLYNIAVPYTSEGQKKEFTLGELKDKYQKFEEAESVRLEAQAKLEAYQQAEQQTMAMLEQHAIQADAVTKAMESQLLADFGQVNWQLLQNQNPAEYIRLSQQFNQRQSQIQQMRQDAIKFMEEQAATIKAQREHMTQQRLLREQQALLKAIPEWRDQTVADAERQKLAQYMLARGYSEQEINAVDDHRALLLVRDAMKYREMMSSASEAQKKVMKLAKKIVTPGSRQTRGEQNNEVERGLRRSLKQTGSTQDAAALISLRLGRKK